MIITSGLIVFSGPVFGNMDNFTGLGIFVDTYPNEEKHIEVRSHPGATAVNIKSGRRTSATDPGRCPRRSV